MDYGSAVLLVRFHNQCDDDTYTHTQLLQLGRPVNCL